MMNSPFAKCNKYAKDGVHTLVVDFKGEKANAALQQFRSLIEKVQVRLNELCEKVASNINGGGQMKVHAVLNTKKRHAAKVSMKFTHERLRFVTVGGEDIPEGSLNFQEYFVQPTACLQDVWIREQKFYPRLFCLSCTVMKKQEEMYEDVDGIEFPEGIFDTWDDVADMEQ